MYVCIYVGMYIYIYIYIYIYTHIYIFDLYYLYFYVLLLVFSVICMHQGSESNAISILFMYSQVHKYWDIDTILTFLALYTTTMDFKWNEQDVL